MPAAEVMNPGAVAADSSPAGGPSARILHELLEVARGNVGPPTRPYCADGKVAAHRKNARQAGRWGM